MKKGKILLVILSLVAIGSFAQDKVDGKKPINLAKAQSNKDIYGIIMSNDVNKNVGLNKEQKDQVADIFNKFNQESTTLKKADPGNYDKKVVGLEKNRNKAVLAILNDKQQAKYKEYIETRKKKTTQE